MLESSTEPGKFTPVSGQYVQRASAFKRARSIAKYNARRRVRVWEYAPPGESKWHEVEA